MLLYIICFLAGGLFGLFGILGMAICKCGAQEDSAKEIYYLRSVLQEVLEWWNGFGLTHTGHIPLKKIKEALKQ